MSGQEYFTEKELAARQAARDIMKPINRAGKIAFAFSLAACIPGGLRIYESVTERQVVPTPIVDFVFPRTIEAEVRRFEAEDYRRQREIPYDRWLREDSYYERQRLYSNLRSEIAGHSLGEAAIEGGALMGLGWLLYHRMKRKALGR